MFFISKNIFEKCLFCRYDSDSPEHKQEVKNHMRDTMKNVGRMAQVIKKTKEEHGSVRKGFVKGTQKVGIKRTVIQNILTRGKEELPFQKENREAREESEASPRSRREEDFDNPDGFIDPFADDDRELDHETTLQSAAQDFDVESADSHNPFDNPDNVLDQEETTQSRTQDFDGVFDLFGDEEQEETSRSTQQEYDVEDAVMYSEGSYESEGVNHRHFHDQSTREWHQYDSDSPEHHNEVKQHMKDKMRSVGRMKDVIVRTKEEHGTVRKAFVKGTAKEAVKHSVIMRATVKQPKVRKQIQHFNSHHRLHCFDVVCRKKNSQKVSNTPQRKSKT